MCKISIITPVYKVEKYLEKCIDSILSQTFTDFELWIVDDGSPDSCGEIADDYARKDARVRVIHKENGGAPSARNAGMEQATGEYLYFPDSDDWLEKDYLEKLYQLAVKTDAQVVISGFTMEYYVKERNQSFVVSVPKEVYQSQEEVRANLHPYFDNMMMAVPWNKLYKASYLKEHQLFFPNIKWDDLHFNMEVIMDVEKVAICSDAGYHFFRSRPGSETTTVFDSMLYQKRKEQFAHILKVYEHWKVEDKEVLSTIYGYYAARLVQCVQEIAISDSPDKKQLIREILEDSISKKALKDGKIDSGLLAIAAIPMRRGNIRASLAMGKLVGFVKLRFATVFYYLKSVSVNKAKESKKK